ncbi:hypothetical protein MAR_035812, partial [Mya arenaria]
MDICPVIYKEQRDAQITAWSFTDSGTTVAAGTGTAPDGAIALSIAENVAVGTRLFTAVATLTSSTFTYAFEADGNPGDVADTTITSGEVKLASGKATEVGGTGQVGTAVVTVSVTDVIVFGQSGYVVCLSSTEVTAAGTDFAKFTVTSATGAVVVAPTVTLKSEEGWLVFGITPRVRVTPPQTPVRASPTIGGLIEANQFTTLQNTAEPRAASPESLRLLYNTRHLDILQQQSYQINYDSQYRPSFDSPTHPG